MNPFPSFGGGAASGMATPGFSTDELLKKLQAQGAQRQQQIFQSMMQQNQPKEKSGGGLSDLMDIAKIAAMFI